MKTISKAGFGLLEFIKAVLGYCDVYKDVKPKKERVEYLENEMDLAVKTLSRLTKELDKLEATLANLNQKYADSMKEKQMLQDKLDEAERRLVSYLV